MLKKKAEKKARVVVVIPPVEVKPVYVPPKQTDFLSAREHRRAAVEAAQKLRRARTGKA